MSHHQIEAGAEEPMALTFVLAQYNGCPYFDRPELHTDIKQDPTLIPEFMAILEAGLTSMKYAEGEELRSYAVRVEKIRTQMTKLEPNDKVGLFSGSYADGDADVRTAGTAGTARTAGTSVVVDTDFQEPAVLVHCPKDRWSFWASLPAVFMGCNAELNAAIRHFLITNSDKVRYRSDISCCQTTFIVVRHSDLVAWYCRYRNPRW